VPAAVACLPGAGARVRFAEAQLGVAPGQACVAYAGTRLLGGGWIARAPLDNADPAP
jgi:tRNA-specific 2-thiouridylase